MSGELWVSDLDSGQRQRLLPDFLMQHYAISADGQRLVFVAANDTGRSRIWLAPVNGRAAPRQVTPIEAWRAYFGWDGYVVFVGEGKFAYRIKEDGSDYRR